MKPLTLSSGMVIIMGSLVVNAQKDYSSMMHLSHGSKVSLTETGVAPFSVAQEAITILETNANINWGRVNLEVLRLHLL